MKQKNIDQQSVDYIVKSLFAGGIAGCCAKTCIAPLDRIKILFQTSNPSYTKYSGKFFGVFKAIHEIRTQYGVMALFQGKSLYCEIQCNSADLNSIFCHHSKRIIYTLLSFHVSFFL